MMIAFRLTETLLQVHPRADPVAGAPPKCRYAALATIRWLTTDSGRMAVSGKSYMATGGQNPMSADIRPALIARVRIAE